MHTNQSSLVRPYNCSLKSPLCAAVCTQAARIFPPFCTLQMRTPRACNDGTERTGAKYSLIDRGYLLKEILALLYCCHYIKGMFSYLISTRSKAVFYKPSLTHKRHLSHPCPLLCSIQSPLYPAQRPLFSFNETDMGKQAVWGLQLLTGFINWARQKSDQNKQQRQTQKEKNPLCFKRSSLCVHC